MPLCSDSFGMSRISSPAVERHSIIGKSASSLNSLRFRPIILTWKGGLMDRLWAPWRIGYILQKKPDRCIFCDRIVESPETLVLYQGVHSLVMMNRYPYTNGHLMVAPLRHTADPGALSPEETLEIFSSVVTCRNAL